MDKKVELVMDICLTIIIVSCIFLSITLIIKQNKINNLEKENEKLKMENAIIKTENKVLQNDYWDLIDGLDLIIEGDEI